MDVYYQEGHGQVTLRLCRNFNSDAGSLCKITRSIPTISK
nr:MAG TPA: hypothetical protein [Caudoviricetes sp.]